MRFFLASAAEGGELAIFARLLIGGGGVGDIAIENFFDGLLQQLAELVVVDAEVFDSVLVDEDVRLKGFVRRVAHEEQRGGDADTFVMCVFAADEVGVIEGLEGVAVAGLVAQEELVDGLGLLEASSCLVVEDADDLASAIVDLAIYAVYGATQ